MGKKDQKSNVIMYLAAYNFLQFIGWAYGLYKFGIYMLTKGTYHGVWPEVQYSILFFQTLQMIEVIHCIIGLVPSNAFQTFLQILSRVFVIWGILYSVPESRDSIGVPLILFSWPIAECTRYLYYALHLFDAVPLALTWARYTFFIVLYPTGLTGELLTIMKAYPYTRDRELYSLTLPNAANISLYYYIILIGASLSYIPFFPQLYIYMLNQRKKILGSPADVTSKKENVKSK